MKLVLKCIPFLLAALMAGCTEETQNGGDNKPSPGETDSGQRREVLLTLKNKLALKKASTKADDPIATAEENTISTLDIYVFASGTEGGEYTYQERFAYRADGSKLPEGASELELTPGKDETQTTGLLNLKKGLFAKLYCVANQPTLVDPAHEDQTLADAAFVPLTFTKPGEQGTQIATPGQPTETDFLTFHTPLLQADVTEDILNTPLAMSGAYTTPIDLTDFGSSARVQAGFKLTRLAARFDIINDAKTSRFTIESISMGNGRRGATLFPIRIYGEIPDAQDGELITYPQHDFSGDKANEGIQTGAFYSYPSPLKDNGYLILKGTYQVNQTDIEKVSYKIPFTQEDGNGNATSLDIANNHRYTIAITKADDYHLDFTLAVADWADDGSIDEYLPDDGSGSMNIVIPGGFTGLTEYNPDTKTVSMSLNQDSEFDIEIGTTSALIVQKTYQGGLEAQQYDWLEISAPQTRGITRSTVMNNVYTFTKKEGYTGSRFPRAVIRFTNVMDGSETVLFVEAVAAPQLSPVQQDAKNHNTLDIEQGTVSMYRTTGSKIKVNITCPDGTTVKEDQPEWLEVKGIATNLSTTTYEIKLKDEYRDREIAGNTGTVTFVNAKKEDMETGVIVNLLDASIAPSFSGLGGTGNSYEAPKDATPGNVNMPLTNGNTFTVGTRSLDGVSVGYNFDGGPAWLQQAGAPSTKAGNETNEIIFSLNQTEIAKGQAKKATVTLTNISGGIEHTFTVTPEFQTPVFAYANGNSPVQNTMSSNNITLYQVANSRVSVKASSLGGTYIKSQTGVTVTGGDNYNTDNTYTVTWDGKTTSNGSFVIANKSDENLTTTINVALPSAAITANSLSVNAANNGSTNIQVKAAKGVTAAVLNNNWNGGTPWFDINASGVSNGDGNLVITQRNNVNTIMKPVTIRLTNKIAGGGDKDIVVTPVLANPTLNKTNAALDNVINENTTSTTFNVTPVPGKYIYSIVDGNIASVSQNGDILTVTAKKRGTTNIQVKNASDNSKVTNFTITVNRDYQGKAVWKYYGFYIAPVDAGTCTWNGSLTTNYCSNKSGATWFVPTADQWRKILGGTSGDANAQPSLHNEFLTKNVLTSDKYYWSTTEANSSNTYSVSFNSYQMYVSEYSKTNARQVRCVAQ